MLKWHNFTLRKWTKDSFTTRRQYNFVITPQGLINDEQSDSDLNGILHQRSVIITSACYTQGSHYFTTLHCCLNIGFYFGLFRLYSLVYFSCFPGFLHRFPTKFVLPIFTSSWPFSNLPWLDVFVPFDLLHFLWLFFNNIYITRGGLNPALFCLAWTYIVQEET